MTQPHDMFNLRHLRAVVAIAERGSISAAAQDINLSQPAITQGLARLEVQLGVPLFDRHADGLSPTEAGELLVPRIVTALDHLATAARSIRRSGNGGFERFDRLVRMSQIRALIAVARSGSFVSAAHEAGLSQPALHSATRDVERLSGVTLVVRRGRGIALSAAGSRLARGFHLAMRELAAGVSELETLQGCYGGHIAIGAMPLCRARLLPRAVAALHKSYPAVQIRIAEGSHAELIEPLRDGEIDVLIGAIRDPAPGRDVTQEVLFRDSLVIIGRVGHPLCNSVDPTVSDLARWQWIMPQTGTPLRRQWEALFKSAGIPTPPIAIECGSVLALRGMLLEDDFLTLLSPDQVALELRTGILRQIGGPLDRTIRSIGMTTRSGWRPTEMQSRFIALLRQLGDDPRLPGFE